MHNSQRIPSENYRYNFSTNQSPPVASSSSAHPTTEIFAGAVTKNSEPCSTKNLKWFPYTGEKDDFSRSRTARLVTYTPDSFKNGDPLPTFTEKFDLPPRDVDQPSQKRRRQNTTHPTCSSETEESSYMKKNITAKPPANASLITTLYHASSTDSISIPYSSPFHPMAVLTPPDKNSASQAPIAPDESAKTQTEQVSTPRPISPKANSAIKQNNISSAAYKGYGLSNSPCKQPSPEQMAHLFEEACKTMNKIAYAGVLHPAINTISYIETVVAKSLDKNYAIIPICNENSLYSLLFVDILEEKLYYCRSVFQGHATEQEQTILKWYAKTFIRSDYTILCDNTGEHIEKLWIIHALHAAVEAVKNSTQPDFTLKPVSSMKTIIE